MDGGALSFVPHLFGDRQFASVLCTSGAAAVTLGLP
jgi:hypothetical protein